MKSYYRQIARASNGFVPPLGPLTPKSRFVGMIYGAKLNGRPYEQGCTVTYLPRVRVRGNVIGVGGRAGSSMSTKVAVINMFYIFDTGAILVDITDLPVIERCRSILVVRRYKAEYLDGFKRIQALINSPDRTLIYIDSITAKAHTAPHFTQDDLTCIIPMWDAR